MVARHVDRVLGLTVQSAYLPELPPDQFEASLAYAVMGLAALAKPHANGTACDGWALALETATTAEDFMDVFKMVYDTLWRSGVLRPSPLESEDV